MRFFSRNDTSLALALIISLIVVFQRPIGWLYERTRRIEVRYDLDILPGLAILLVALAIHEYRRRRSPKASTAGTPVESAQAPARTEELQQLVAFGRAVEVAQARARADELQRLVAFGRALGQAVEAPALKQVLVRYMPVFARDRAFWVLTRVEEHWDEHVQDFRIAGRSNDELERMAAEAIVQRPGPEADGPGVLVAENLCFPLVVGEVTVGVLGVRNTPAIGSDERRALGAVVALVAIAVRNVQLLTQARDHSLRDRLTGCFSHAHGIDTLKAELRRARRTRHPLSVVMFDVDHFKLINDRYGHLVGDMVLEAVGKALSRVLRVSDLKCRYGGDEFFVVLPETPLSGAVQAAESLLREIGQVRLACGEHTVTATVSVGVAGATPDDVNPEVVIARADDAMYQAKRMGRNRYVVAPEPKPAPKGLQDSARIISSAG